MLQSEDLVREALRARQQAYAPYSGFAVGAALLAVDGRIFTGCNVENASYGLTTCAERTALVKAVSEGAREFEGLALVAEGQEACFPCGACRQVLAEFNPHLDLVLANTAGEIERYSLAELLPRSFRFAPGGGNKTDE